MVLKVLGLKDLDPTHHFDRSLARCCVCWLRTGAKWSRLVSSNALHAVAPLEEIEIANSRIHAQKEARQNGALVFGRVAL